MKAFQTLDDLKAASEEELAQVEGMTVCQLVRSTSFSMLRSRIKRVKLLLYEGWKRFSRVKKRSTEYVIRKVK